MQLKTRNFKYTLIHLTLSSGLDDWLCKGPEKGINGVYTG